MVKMEETGEQGKWRVEMEICICQFGRVQFYFEFAVWSLNLHPCSRGKGDGLSFNWVKSNALIGHVAFYYLCQTDNNFLARFKFSGLYIYSFQVFYYFGVRIYLFEYCRSIWKFYYFKNLVLINILLTWMFFL
jgi:hypothetical protein